MPSQSASAIARSIIQAAISGDPAALSAAWGQVGVSNGTAVAAALKQATPAEQLRMNDSFTKAPDLWQAVPKGIVTNPFTGNPILGSDVRAPLQQASANLAVTGDAGPAPAAVPPVPTPRPPLTQMAANAPAARPSLVSPANTATLPQLPEAGRGAPVAPAAPAAPGPSTTSAVMTNAAPSGPVPPMNVGPGAGSQSQAIIAEANRIGANPLDLARVISYETAGTFSPAKYGGTGGKYLGVIQFGPSEQKTYGVTADQTFGDQVAAAGKYLQDRGFKPGMGLAEMYSIVNAGSLTTSGQPRWNASDGNGTVRQHVARMETGAYDIGPITELAAYNTTTGGSSASQWQLRPGMGTTAAPDPRVASLQTGLNSAGASLKVDGVYGPATQTAVRAYEKAHGLSVDRGVAGMEVLSHLHTNGLLPDPLTASGQLGSGGGLTFTPGKSLEMVTPSTATQPAAGPAAGQPGSPEWNARVADTRLGGNLTRARAGLPTVAPAPGQPEPQQDPRFIRAMLAGPPSSVPPTASPNFNNARPSTQNFTIDPLTRGNSTVPFTGAPSRSALVSPPTAYGTNPMTGMPMQPNTSAPVRPALAPLTGSVTGGSGTGMTMTGGKPPTLVPQGTSSMGGGTGAIFTQRNPLQMVAQPKTPPLPQLRPTYQPPVVPASLKPSLNVTGNTIDPITGQPAQPPSQPAPQASTTTRPPLVSSGSAAARPSSTGGYSFHGSYVTSPSGQVMSPSEYVSSMGR